ncbi:MAG: tRNA (adenosine(37)-N6)-threonylcarbamoyltransferase complex ATPase subunit type 1 TsaE [Acidobacteria bacterium]|nr:MAG: tRNA (adenosine(37)-N6)-threonylcarbamoyltransferase complex ATPase subunit type 1 TsaE [Acidobacteriota bacterium]
MDEQDSPTSGNQTVLAARLSSADSMRAFGWRLAALLRPGDVILLSGKLGAGKTTLAQGIAAGLGVEEQVTSPTFVLLQEYEGRIPLRHADLYRLESTREIAELGIEELFDQHWVTLIEWGLPAIEMVAACLSIEIDYGAGMTGREIRLRAFGGEWKERRGALEAILVQYAQPLNTTIGDDTANSRD